METAAAKTPIASPTTKAQIAERTWAHLAAHHGVISRQEAIELGMSRHQIKRRRDTGEWIEVQPHVFRHAAAPETWLGSARTAALCVDSLVSHRAAARLWGLDGFERSRIEVVVSDDRHVHRHSLTVHRSVHMQLCGQTIRHGVPVTGIARTILDVAAVSGLRRLRHAIDSAFRLQLVTWRGLYSVLVRHSARGRNGCGKLRHVLEEHYGDAAVPDSNWNRDVGILLGDGLLPVPEFEHEVFHKGAFVARVDLAYPDRRLAIECDSVRWHRNSESFVRDPRRRNKLLNAGWRVLSFTWDDYANHPRALVAAVTDAYEISAAA